MCRLHDPENRAGRYGSLTLAQIKLLQQHFIKDVKYGCNPRSLLGQTVCMEELEMPKKPKSSNKAPEQIMAA